jgi:predicted amidophosphoribosyltransferase
MNRFLLLNEINDFLVSSVAQEFKCKRCGWRLRRDEENYCDSCVETMQKENVEHEIDECREETRKYNSIIK